MKKQYIKPVEREFSVDTRMIAFPSASAPDPSVVVNPSKGYDSSSDIWSNMESDDSKESDAEE